MTKLHVGNVRKNVRTELLKVQSVRNADAMILCIDFYNQSLRCS